MNTTMITMEEQKKEIDNSVFISTLTGVVLLIVAVVNVLMAVNTSQNDQPYIFTSILSGAGATALLMQAMRKDKRRTV